MKNQYILFCKAVLALIKCVLVNNELTNESLSTVHLGEHLTAEAFQAKGFFLLLHDILKYLYAYR